LPEFVETAGNGFLNSENNSLLRNSFLNERFMNRVIGRVW
jgi:hypothetical protein